MTNDSHRHFTSSPEQWEKLKPLTREMRHHPTPAEDALWQRLRCRRIGGAKFRRQHAIDGFIVDFVCIERQLVVEVDGSIHARSEQQAYDTQRQAVLTAQGFRVLRFTNDEVLHSLDTVVEAIGNNLTDGDSGY